MSLDEVSDVDIGGLKESRLDYDFINRHVITDTECPVIEEKEKDIVSVMESEEDQRIDSRRILKARNDSFVNQKIVTDLAVIGSDVSSSKKLGINKFPRGDISDKASDDDRDRLSQTSCRTKTSRVSFISPAGKSIIPFDTDDNEGQRKAEGENKSDVSGIGTGGDRKSHV